MPLNTSINKSSSPFYLTLYLLLIGAIVVLQIVLLSRLQLFGDEAFYWLEGQHLALSYAELPAFTAWMIRIGTEIFGKHYFAVRSISFLAYLSIFYCVYLLNDKKNCLSASTLVFAIPLFMLIAIMALPDIWLLFFVMWLIYFLKKALKTNKNSDWLILAVLTALSLNVHVRMWIWLFFAGVSFLFFFREKKFLKPIALIFIPITALGMIPILIFNYQHEYALFAFQFARRNPWQFQLSNISFVLSQLLVITPFVLFVWFKSLTKIKQMMKSNKFTAWLLITAAVHWLFYVIMSLFADGLRTTVHWVLISYVPVLAITPMLLKNSKTLLLAAHLTGIFVSIVLLLYLSLNKDEGNNIAARILDNSTGWKQLATTVKKKQQLYEISYIIADYFMTAAELAFELKQSNQIFVLKHQKNVKHGRQKQLEIMNMLLTKPQTFQHQALLVVEDSTLKLKNKGKYYAKLCQNFKQLHFLQSLNINKSNKKFNLFLVSNLSSKPKTCEIPPLFYVQHIIKNNKLIISGWVIMHKTGIKSLSLNMNGKQFAITDFPLKNTGIAQQFPEIKDPNLPLAGFKIQLGYNPKQQKSFTILAKSIENKYYDSQLYYIR